MVRTIKSDWIWFKCTIVNSRSNLNLLEPVKEVVSIYGENFETPKSREPYFITIHRCITLCDNNRWPHPTKQKEVEIVVPDVNDRTKFYKYVVRSHISCGLCEENKLTLHKHSHSHEGNVNLAGNLKTLKLVTRDLVAEGRGSNQTGFIRQLFFFSVDEAEFKKKVPKNPVNLINCNPLSFCSRPQPRYKLNHWGLNAVPEHRLIRYQRCLPGCKATTKNVHLCTEMNSGGRRCLSLETHTACAPYRTKPFQRKHAHHPCKSNKSIMNKDKRATK